VKAAAGAAQVRFNRFTGCTRSTWWGGANRLGRASEGRVEKVGLIRVIAEVPVLKIQNGRQQNHFCSGRQERVRENRRGSPFGRPPAVHPYTS
jgi:hypothetical protein